MAGLLAKLDTGARGAALHASEIFVDGERVRFVLHPGGGPPRPCDAPLADLRRVTSSNGAAELRPFIRTPLTLGGLPARTIEVSLTGRPGMRYPVLVGRAALSAWKALVDPDETVRPNLR